MNTDNRYSLGFVVAWGDHRFCIDTTLLMVVLALLTVGYVMVTSASLHLGETTQADVLFYPKRQLINLLIALAASLVAMSIPLRIWQRFHRFLFVFGMMALVLVLIPGLSVEVKGANRWLQLAGMRFQVSEIFKLTAVIYMAGYIARKNTEINSSVLRLIKENGWHSIGKILMSPCGLFLFACLLLLKEPDFGSAVITILIVMSMFFLAGARIGIFLFLTLLVVASACLLVYTEPYRWERVIGFIDPWKDPQDKGFQLVQALMAFGQGGVLGVGLGGSVQKLFYLPEAHTDFLFSVIAEELGLIGVIVVIALFTLVVWRSFLIGQRAENLDRPFAAYLAFGIGIWFGLQAFINMGVNMGMLPTKGLTLPLMSYGGSSLMVMCVAIAILLRIHSETVHAGSEVARLSRGSWG